MHAMLMVLGFWQIATASSPPPAAQVPNPIVSYTIEARLNPEARAVQGQLSLVYTNRSPDIIADLQFHAYLNAALNTGSTYAQDDGSLWSSGQERFGYLQIEACKIDGNDALPRITYLQAPDATPEDRTVFSIPLLEPLMPGESRTINFHFKSKLPYRWNRAGYAGKYFFVAQWFPKIGVWETRGQRGRQTPGWNCHAPHGNTEFYADFGTYDVRLSVPTEYVVGATGAQQGEPEQSAQETTYHFRQERVHDFAWVAWPDFMRRTETFQLDRKAHAQALHHYAKQFNTRESELLPRPVQMNLLIAPEHISQTDRHFRAMREALTFCALRLMPYPYETITMVDMPEEASFAGGMEYPTLIALGTRFHNPRKNRDLERLIYHEFMHEYFYGLVASNEFEESWLDEGFTFFMENKIVDTLHPGTIDYRRFPATKLVPRLGILGLSRDFKILSKLDLHVPSLERFLPVKATRAEVTRWEAIKERGRSRIASPAWHQLDYTSNAYDKPATMLLQLERELGPSVVENILYTYVRRMAFAHPGEADFIAIAEEVAGQKLAWFFNPVLRGTGTLDFSVSPPTTEPLELEGFRLQDHSPVPVASGAEPNGYRNRFTVIKDGSVDYPVDLLVRFTDGTEVRERWLGDAPWKHYQFESASQIESVEVDPLHKVAFDKDRFNNSYVVTPDNTTSRSYKARLILLVQHLLQSLVGGF